MYTRNYRISREDPLPQIAEPQPETLSDSPPCEENESECRKKRYKATRIPRLIEPVTDETEEFEPPAPPKCEDFISRWLGAECDFIPERKTSSFWIFCGLLQGTICADHLHL